MTTVLDSPKPPHAADARTSTLGRRLRRVGRDLWETFFAGPVRENAIRARGGGMPGALAVVAGLLAFAVAALGVLFSGQLAARPIGTGSATLGSATTPGDPIGIPVLAYPALMSLLLISVAIGAFGAVFAKRTLATIAVALVLLPSILFAGTAWRFREVGVTGWLALPATLLIPIAVIGLRRLRARPALALPVTSMLAALSVGGSALAQITAFTQAGTSGGLPLFGSGLETALTMLGILIAPTAILAGAGAVSFGRTVTGFLGRSIDRLTPGDGILTGITLALVLLALAMSVHDIAAAASPARWVLRVTCAAALILAAMRWWRWAARGVPVGADAVESGAATGGPTLALVLAAFTAPLTLLLVLATVVTTLTGDIALVEASNALATAMGHAWTGTLYAVCAGLFFLLAAAVIARARPGVSPAWLGLAAATLVVLVTWNQLFAAPQWGGFVLTDIARGGAIVIAAMLAIETWRQRSVRAALAAWGLRDLFALSALLVLVLHGSFVADPFAAVLGFTGIGLVFFGVVWGFLTSGAHSSVTGLAGLGRTAVLLAYAVLSTSLLAWGLVTGAGGVSTLSGQFGQLGSNVLGSALLLALLAARPGSERVTN